MGLHTCGDLAPSMLRMFAAKAELLAVCGVGCCYNKLSEQFQPDAPGPNAFGFPLSQHLRRRSWFCGRNARMSACLVSSASRVRFFNGADESLTARASFFFKQALERVAVGHGVSAPVFVWVRSTVKQKKNTNKSSNHYSSPT